MIEKCNKTGIPCLMYPASSGDAQINKSEAQG